MRLIEQVKNICNRLASTGWQNLLLHHGLDIQSPSLEDELRKPLRIDRTLAGFEDFALKGTRGIEPGQPAQSLLYHALASANVTLDAGGSPLQAYPTAAELETVLNLVYGMDPPDIEQLKERARGAPLAVVVFASEYRPAPDTVHQTQADLCFSRTGVTRVGTTPALYDAQRRGFLPFVEGYDHAIRVLPARYSAYVAVQRKGDPSSFGPMRFDKDDTTRDFWVPLHKLFNGEECIAGLKLDLELQTLHKNEKLRRIHLYLGANSGWGEPDISRPPFVMTERLAGWLGEAEYGPGLLSAIPRKRLVEAAYYQGKPLTFRVPDLPDLLDSSMALNAHAPAFVHIRHKVDGAGNVVNLNRNPDMMAELREGRFTALHYLDYTGDGWVNARCTALDAIIPERIAAYSLLSAPDFYPLCNQRHLSEWLESMPTEVAKTLFPTPPTCLSDARLPANVQSFTCTFNRADVGITSIVAQPDTRQCGEIDIKPKVASARRASCLPDAAAGVFAPGWDTGWDSEDGSIEQAHLAAYKLGSPFPEDAKLCAALSSFWPAVAPDSVQQFEPSNRRHTVKPMLDSEIGMEGHLPWDGIQPPKTYMENGQPHIAFTSSLYGDYTQSALDGKFSLALTGKVDSQEYQQRVDALRRVRLLIGESHKEWRIASFRVATDDDMKTVDTCHDLKAPLTEKAYRFEMVRLMPAASETFDKVELAVTETYTYLVWPQYILHRQASPAWQRA